jgi:ribosomal protein L32
MDLDDLRIPANRHGYIYFITFVRPTDQHEFYYVGQHLGKEMSRRYVGSGTRINNLYRKYGKRGHKQLLLWAYSQEELNFYERMCISFAKIEYARDCVNLSFGDRISGGLSRESRRKVSEAQLLRWDHASDFDRHRLSEARRLWWENSSPDKKATFSTMVSNNMLAFWHNRSPSELAMSRERIAAPKRGKKYSNEHRQAMREGRKRIKTVECPHCGVFQLPNTIYKYHFDNCPKA